MAFVYRHFSSTGELLYIGCTQSILQRTEQHLRRCWGIEIARIDVVHFDSRWSAMEYEALAILKEQPKYNIDHKQLPRLKSFGFIPVTNKAIKRKASLDYVIENLPKYSCEFKKISKAIGLSEMTLHKILAGASFSSFYIEKIEDYIKKKEKKRKSVQLIDMKD